MSYISSPNSAHALRPCGVMLICQGTHWRHVKLPWRKQGNYRIATCSVLFPGSPKYSRNYCSQVPPTRDTFLDSSPTQRNIGSPICHILTIPCSAFLQSHLCYLNIIHHIIYVLMANPVELDFLVRDNFDMSLCCIFRWKLVSTE